jgi:hypothetical protein
MNRSDRSRAAKNRTEARLAKAAEKLARRREKRLRLAPAQDDLPPEPPPGAPAQSK